MYRNREDFKELVDSLTPLEVENLHELLLEQGKIGEDPERINELEGEVDDLRWELEDRDDTINTLEDKITDAKEALE